MNAFKRNLIIGYGISLLLLIVSAVASYISISNLLFSARLVNHTNEVVKKVERVLTGLVDAETGQRGYLLTGKKEFLDLYNEAPARTNKLLNDIKNITADNVVQQEDAGLLRIHANSRLNYLEKLIVTKRNGEAVSDSLLVEGKRHMDAVRAIVKRMQEREEALLNVRTKALNRFAASTPTLILIACALGIIVTVISFARVLNDYEKRTALQLALQEKDEQISQRINMINSVATEISDGNYTIQVEEQGDDALASIAGSLNKMSQALHITFSELKDQQWMQAGIAQLNEIMIGKKELEILSYDVIDFITNYTGSAIGAFYLRKDENSLQLAAGIGISHSEKAGIIIGEGVAGQCAQSGRQVLLENIPEPQIQINYSGGTIIPTTILAIPIFYESRLKGVIEIASLESYSKVKLNFLRDAGYNIGMAIHSARDHQRLQELLAETQAQSEELQAQHTELENINAELEAQAERLQTSEEELRVQQEELQHANQELEERSRLLEEKNELILERNLEIQQRADELAQSTRYKSEFLANMSHELRTPLNSILLLSRLLTDNHTNNLTNDQIEYANVIQTSGKGLLTLIDEILDLSKIEAGKMELEYSDVRISEIANELDSLFKPLAIEKGIAFIIEQVNDGPLSIETDRMRLTQILRNLISNALKFTKKGSVTLNIQKKGNDCWFSVKDTGIGIPKEKQALIFEAFQQADGSTRRQFGGTGLGLSISRKLAQLLNGEILLNSEAGEGSEFTLVLPSVKNAKIEKPAGIQEAPVYKEVKVKAVAPPVSEADYQFVSPVIPSPVEDDRANMQQGDKVILIIEDDTAFARSLLDYTRTKGYKGIVAVRGDEGIGLAKQYMPLGILLDLQLPVMSGWQVMDELKSDNRTRHIPVHIMSAYQVKTKSLSKGAVDFINKPVAFEKLGEMFSKIENALNREPKKVLIVEENTQHAKALAYFLSNYNVASEIKNSIDEGIQSLNKNDIDCVILDMGIPAQQSYDTLDVVKRTAGLGDIPIIVFTGKNLSQSEEVKLRQYADSIVVKTAHSYQRILDEVSLFLHLVEENQQEKPAYRRNRKIETGEVLKGKTVLVVDDDVRNIFSLTKSLESYGMNVISAIDGKEALRQLESHTKIDMVLMDMMMPELDGYETTKRLRQMPQYRNLPVIAVTAKAMTGDREKCIAAGASDYITKPVDVDQLISLLRVWLYQ
jgi:signal transduction histidine kinase/DNA-binding response OmpR family regulator/CHASE3 domain sensor protein